MSQSSSKRMSYARSRILPSYAESSEDDQPFDSDDDIYAEHDELELHPDPEDDEQELQEEEHALKRHKSIPTPATTPKAPATAKAKRFVTKKSKGKEKQGTLSTADEVEGFWSFEEPAGWGNFKDRTFTGAPEGPIAASGSVLTAFDSLRMMIPDAMIDLIVDRTNYFISTPRFKPRRIRRRNGEDLSSVTPSEIWRYFACLVLSAIHNKVSKLI